MSKLSKADKQEMRKEAIATIFGMIRDRRTPVKVTNFYETYSDLWSTRHLFLTDLKAETPEDITITSKKRAGTVAVIKGYIAPVEVRTNVKRAIMGGLQACNYEGLPTSIKPNQRTMMQLAKWPKMFEPFAETTGVYRIDLVGAPSQYLQVTDSGNYLFKRV